MSTPADWIRSIVGAIAGVVVAAVAYWIFAVIALLAIRGIPLGSSGGPPTITEVILHMVFAGSGSMTGALTARRIANGLRAPAIAMAIVLAVGAVAGFGKEASTWPRGFGIAMGAACLIGTGIAIALQPKRSDGA